MEKRFAAAVGVRFACAVNSCTAALHLALEAIGVGPGDRVLVPTMTFTATAEVIRYLGADPVFLDVDYGSALLTPSILEVAIRQHPSASAAVVVHFGGQAAQMLPGSTKGIVALCREAGIRLVEDAAHAFPAYSQGQSVGSFGDAGCFSFYANKTLTTGEGGMLVTDDEHLAKRARIMRLHGIDRDIWGRFTSQGSSWEYDVIAPGFKYNMPDVNAAIGLAQLERADEFRAERQRCAEFYMHELSALECVDLPQFHVKASDHSWHLFPIVLTESSPVDRDSFIEAMSQRGIGTSVHYKPLHRMSYYREKYGLIPDSFPNAEKIWRGRVSLPVYPSLSNDDLAYICSCMKEILL